MPELTQPVEHHPHDVVENVYAVPGNPNQPDYQSRDGFEEFLKDRLRPDQQITQAGSIQVLTGYKEVITIPEHPKGEWWMWGTTGKRLAAAAIGATVLVNGAIHAGNITSAVKDGVEIAQELKDKAEDVVHHGWETQACEPTHETAPAAPATPEQHFTTYVQSNELGSAEPNPADVQHIVTGMVELKNEGRSTNSVVVKGLGSDDWESNPNAGHGLPDKENVDLAQDRQAAFMTSFRAEAEAQGLDLSNVKVQFNERIVTDEERKPITELAQQHGFASVEAALKVFDSPDRNTLPAELTALLQEYYGANRGVLVDVAYSEPASAASETITEKPCEPQLVDDGAPKNEDHDYEGHWPIVLGLPPLPILRRRIIKKALYDKVDIPADIPNPEFLKLYPEAMTRAKQLVREAWAYSRKYQNLFGEPDRIPGVYRLNYVDAQGDEQRLRACFVDHEPTPEALATIHSVLEKVSQLQDGRVGRELDMIAVYPSKNAGLHGDPKKVGLGQDIQYEGSTLGVAVPALRLVELHMPDIPTETDLRKKDGMEWVLAHEVAGHFTDLDDKTNDVREIGTFEGAPIYTPTGRFADSAKADFDRATAQEQGKDTRTVRQKLMNLPYTVGNKWRIRRGTQMISGDIEPREDIVTTTDPRLTEAVSVRTETFVDDYSRTDPAEHYAQSAAQKLTGIEVPFSEEPDMHRAQVKPRDGYANTYAASQQMDDLLSERWGSDSTVTEPNQQYWYGHIEDDPELFALAQAAREHPLPSEEELLHIVVGKRLTNQESVSA